MKKNDKHEPYCGCRECKPLDVTDPSTEDTGDWPLIKPSEEKQGPPKEPSDPVRATGG